MRGPQVVRLVLVAMTPAFALGNQAEYPDSPGKPLCESRSKNAPAVRIDYRQLTLRRYPESRVKRVNAPRAPAGTHTLEKFRLKAGRVHYCRCFQGGNAAVDVPPSGLGISTRHDQFTLLNVRGVHVEQPRHAFRCPSSYLVHTRPSTPRCGLLALLKRVWVG